MGQPHPIQPVDVSTMRAEYEANGIEPEDLHQDPVAQFEAWLIDAINADVTEPNAMVVATVDADGQPWSRWVLLKDFDGRGFTFYTNYESFKSTHLTVNPVASLSFGWLELRRQVTIAGTVERVPASESDSYWEVRPRGSQLGGWASHQSREIADRSVLDRQYDEADHAYPDQVPRPPHWGGWRVVPHTVEFWQGRLNRLHDRVRYDSDGQGTWSRRRLSP